MKVGNYKVKWYYTSYPGGGVSTVCNILFGDNVMAVGSANMKQSYNLSKDYVRRISMKKALLQKHEGVRIFNKKEAAIFWEQYRTRTKVARWGVKKSSPVIMDQQDYKRSIDHYVKGQLPIKS